MKDSIYKLWSKVKPYLYIIIFVVIIVVAVAILLSHKSVSEEAINNIKKTTNKEQVQQLWDKYIVEIDSKEGQEKFIKSIKEKLSKMDLTDEEITNWHNKFRMFSNIKPSLNIIVIPDLSNRIQIISDNLVTTTKKVRKKNKKKRKLEYIEEVVQKTEKKIQSNERTIQYDKEIITEIYRLFFQRARSYKSKDKLTIDVTDDSQSGGLFAELAEKLTIDMTEKENNEQSKKYLESKENGFNQSLDSLYEVSVKKNFGADFVYYFNRIAPLHIKKSDIKTEYVNKIIILTDGYLERTKADIQTKIVGYEKILEPAVDRGDLPNTMKKYNLAIPKCRNKFFNIEVLMLEITERPGGVGWHREVLLQYWRDWYMDMGIKNIREDNEDFFQLHQHNVNNTKKIIRSFLDF